MTSTLPSGVRHKRPWSDSSRTLLVPLWYEDPRGEWIVGKIDVPERLAHSQPNTNERFEFDNLVTTAINRWTGWRAAMGWQIASRPKVTGPYEPRTSNSWTAAADPEMYWYQVRARFKRDVPVYAKFEDVLAIREQTERYAKVPTVKDSGWVNPLEYAEKRRQAAGIKRKDYLTGPLWAMKEPPPAPPSGVREVAP